MNSVGAVWQGGNVYGARARVDKGARLTGMKGGQRPGDEVGDLLF